MMVIGPYFKSREFMLIDIHTHHNKKNALFESLFLEEDTHFVGIHPWYLEVDILAVESKIRNNPHLLIGEIGLDKLKSPFEFSRQKVIFLKQLKIAIELKRPIVLHVLKAHEEMLVELKKERPELLDCPLLIHDFSGNEEDLKRYLKTDLNVYFSFGAALFRRSSKLNKVMKAIPLDRLFLETDAHEKLNIEEVYLQLSHWRDESYLEERLEKNFQNFLGDFLQFDDMSAPDFIKKFHGHFISND